MATVNVGDLTFVYDEYGKKGDPVIMMVMGLGGSRVLFHQDLCQGLADQGFRVIRFDNRDVGESSKITDKKAPNFNLFLILHKFFRYTMNTPYVLKDMAADVVGIMDALEIDKAHLVGVSMGGMIMQQCLIHHGDRFMSGAAIMTSSLNQDLPEADPQLVKLMMSPMKNPSDKQAVFARGINIVTALSGSKYPMDEKIKETLHQAVEIGRDEPGFFRQIMAITATPSMSGELQLVEHPVVVIHGDQDKLVRPEAGKDIHANLPNSTFELIEGMGHTLPGALFPTFIDLIIRNARKAER